MEHANGIPIKTITDRQAWDRYQQLLDGGFNLPYVVGAVTDEFPATTPALLKYMSQ